MVIKFTNLRLAIAIACSILWLGNIAFAQTTGPSAPTTTIQPTSQPSGEGRNVFRPGLVRIDFSISTSVPTNWEGELRLTRGEFADPVPLGTVASSPTDFLFSDSTKNTLALRTRTESTFCGVETTIFAPHDSRLEIRLRDCRQNKVLVKTVFVDRLIDSAIRIPLDQEGSEIEIVRAPADDLPLKIEVLRGVRQDVPIETTVFQPGDRIRITTLPRSSSRKLPNQFALTINVKSNGSQETFFSDSREISLSELQRLEAFVDDNVSTREAYEFSFLAPPTDGVFEATLELASVAESSTKSTFAFNPAKRRQETTVFAKRTIQGIVISPQVEKNESNENDNISIEDLRVESLLAIDPTNPSWYKAFSKHPVIPFYRPNVKGMSKGSNFFTSTSLDDSGIQDTSASENDPTVPKTFEEEPPIKFAYPNAAPETSSDDSRILLGQTPIAKNANGNSLGKNLLGFVPNLTNNGANQSSEEQLYCLRRWEKDRFQSFIRNLDQNKWGLVANLWEKPLSSGSSRAFDSNELAEFATPQSHFLRLESNRIDSDSTKSTGKESVSWEAYPIPIANPGVPHILEIEYPVNFPQKLGISVIEQGPSGGIFPSSFDTGLTTSAESLSDRGSNEVARFTTLFWPQTSTPIILMSNCSSETAAAYGQIRIYKADSIKNASVSSSLGRTFGLALTSPNICRQFSASKKASAFGLVGSEDWVSFEEAISRLLYYMTASNVDSTMAAFVSDGSALYPSQRLNPSPRYDGGIFLPTGGDSVRKDVLTASLALFTQRHKKLTPLVNLNAPLPELETKLASIRSHAVSQEEQASLEGIEWIGADGRKLIDSRLTEEGTGPYYNILHPEVEKEALAVVGELVNRCASFDCFDGLALDVGAGGWLALPDDVYYGMDDETIARFVRETSLQEVLSSRGERRVQELLLAKGVERYRYRAEFIRDNCLNEWIEWRIDALYRFYRQVRQTIANSRPDVRLYLVATNALDGPICKSMLYPSLTNGKKLREALRLVGLDPVRFSPETRKRKLTATSQVSYESGDPSSNKYDSLITLLRPELVSSTASFVQTALQDDLSDPDSISLFNGTQINSGSLFYHKPIPKPLYEFDELCPYRPAVVELQTLALPSGYENRRRFARTLAVEDSMCFFDGGDVVPVGQEETLHDWIYVFKSLPNVQFKTWTPKSDINNVTDSKTTQETPEEKTIQPLVVRYYRTEKETWLYLLNAAPFHLGVKLSAKKSPSASFEAFASIKHDRPNAYADSLDWNFTASPYDLVAIRIDDAKTTIDSIEVSRPAEICGSEGRLNAAVQDFVERILIARTGVSIELRNSDFEETPRNGSIVVENEEPDRLAGSANSNEKRTDRPNIFGLEPPKFNPFPFKRINESSVTSENSAPEANVDQSSIPGWRAFGPSDVEVTLDDETANNGQHSLRIASKGNVGGIICQPFTAPSTGRLCAQISFGIPVGVSELPLNVCLVGRYNGKPFSRRVSVGSAVLKRSQNLNQEDAENGIVWLRDVVLFDRLPLDGLEDLSLRFELCGSGSVWLDQIRLYKLAFTDAEQNELMKIINNAEFRVSQDRTLDVLFMLDGYWSKLLSEQIPEDSDLLAARPKRPVNASLLPEKEEENKQEEKGVFNRAFNRLKFW